MRYLGNSPRRDNQGERIPLSPGNIPLATAFVASSASVVVFRSGRSDFRDTINRLTSGIDWRLRSRTRYKSRNDKKGEEEEKEENGGL